MNLNPINQKFLYGYDDLFLLFKKLNTKNKLPNKLIISGPKGIGKATFSYHFINYLLSKNEEYPYVIDKFEIQNENRSYNLIKNMSHPNFHLVDLLEDKNKIEINQIRRAIEYSQKSSFNNNLRIILVDNLEFLTINSVNALLKIIEEANDKLLFILIHNSEKKILETIKSRCIIFKRQFTSNENISFFKELTQKNSGDIFNLEILNNYLTVGELFHLFNFAKDNNLNLMKMSLKSLLIYLFNLKNLKSNDYVLNLIFKLIQSYFFYKSLEKRNLDSYNLYSFFLKKIDNAKKFNLDFYPLFLEFENKVLNG